MNFPRVRRAVPEAASGAIVVAGVHKSFSGAAVLRDVDLRVEPGSVVALLGPSGCGKTTLLRTVAGLERLDDGEVYVGDVQVSGRRHHLPPERRRVGLVFQDWALFPHMSVAQNVGYGLSRADRRAGRVTEALEMVGLADLAERRPGTLSGGQQQRVALARALAPRPEVLLMDEPFSNLDTSLRVQIRSEVQQLLVSLGVTTVFVTHDQEEAFVLGDEVAVMQGGRVVQQASPATLYAAPATPWVARFVGDANLLDAVAGDGVARTSVGAVPLEEALEGPVQVMLRPEELRLAAAGAGNGNGDGGAVDGVIELEEYYGHDTLYVVRLGDGGRVRVRVWSVPEFARGDAVVVSYAGPPARAFVSESDSAAAGGDGGGRADGSDGQDSLLGPLYDVRTAALASAE